MGWDAERSGQVRGGGSDALDEREDSFHANMMNIKKGQGKGEEMQSPEHARDAAGLATKVSPALAASGSAILQQYTRDMKAAVRKHAVKFRISWLFWRRALSAV
jgi:hypothetical protein